MEGQVDILSSNQVTGVILSGGRSSRMGQNKAFLSVSNQSMIEAQVALFNQLFAETIVVSNEPELYQYLGVKVIKDIIPRKGPLSGMHAGLTEAQNQYSFIVPCDMPFLQADLIRLLISEAPGYDVIVPQIDDYLQPLHSIYHKRCIQPIENCLRDDVFKIIAFYPWVKVKFVGEKKMNSICSREQLEQIFMNINTQKDLDYAKKIQEAN